MPTPDGLTITTLHGKFVEPNSSGTPLKGTLTFTPNPAVITFPAENVIVTGTETATLDDVTGEFTIDLISTDQAGENPTGWTYSVTEKLVGQKQRTYLIALPNTLGITVELSDVTPTDAAPTYIPVIGPAGAPGLITSINGHSTSSVTLTAADVGAVATTARGAANGVASLDAATKVPVAQIPDISATYITTARIGAASGVAGLTGGGLVTSTQLDLASTTPTAIADTGAVGTATQLARADHTHSGVSLAGNQSPAGNKTWTGSAYFTGTEVGIGVTASLGGRVDIRTASAGLTVLALQNTNGASTASILKITGDTNTAVLMTGLVTGDAQNRFAIRSTGQIEMGSGAAARDVNFYRSAVGVLNSSGQLASDAAAPTAVSHLTRKDYVDNNFSSLTGSQTISGAKTFTAVQTLQGSTATVLQQHKVTGDTNNRFQITTDGALSFGPGNAAVDVTLSRSSGGSLSNTVNYQSNRATNLLQAYTALVAGDTNDRWRAYADGKQEWGTGAAARDTNLYRSGVGILKTDTAFQVGTDLTVSGNINSATNLIMGAWTSYSVAWTASTTNPVIGNGTLTGRYQFTGKSCIAKIFLSIGSTTTMGTGTWSFSLPFTVVTGSSGNDGYVGQAFGSRSTWHSGTVVAHSAATTCVISEAGSGSAWSVSVPATWVSGDYVIITIEYETA